MTSSFKVFEDEKTGSARVGSEDGRAESRHEDESSEERIYERYDWAMSSMQSLSTSVLDG
jgi:hypothetical protein